MIICGSLPRLKIFSVRIGRRVEVVIWLAKCQSAEQGGIMARDEAFIESITPYRLERAREGIGLLKVRGA